MRTSALLPRPPQQGPPAPGLHALGLFFARPCRLDAGMFPGQHGDRRGSLPASALSGGRCLPERYPPAEPCRSQSRPVKDIVPLSACDAVAETSARKLCHDLRGARTSGATCSKSWSSPLWQRRLEGKRREARTSGRPAIALTPVRLVLNSPLLVHLEPHATRLTRRSPSLTGLRRVSACPSRRMAFWERPTPALADR